MDNKIGIVTVYGENNYGNKLQNYACVKLYESLGYSVDTLCVTQSRLCLKGTDKLKKNLKRCLCFFPSYNYLKRQFLKEKKFVDFSEKYLNITQKYTTSTIKQQNVNCYSVLSIGSDQVWNDTDFNEDDFNYYTLNRLSAKRIITLSASMGKKKLQQKNELEFAAALKKYHSISCRESEGAAYIEKLTGKKCCVLTDPTLALVRSDWEKIETPLRVESSYTLCYFLGEIKHYKEDVVNKCYQNRLKLVDVLDKKSIFYGSSPSEFIYLIHHSDLVCTDSFHACVFSIIFNKRFVLYKRRNQESDMSSRIENLLKVFSIDVVEYGKVYDFLDKQKFVMEVIENERNKINSYLLDALKEIK